MDQYSLQELPFKHNPTFKTYQSVLFQFQELLESHIKKNHSRVSQKWDSNNFLK